MARALNWGKAHQHETLSREPLLEDRRDRPSWIRKGSATSRKTPGITNAQAKYLAQLCRQHGIPYVGQGMTRAQASTTILGLQKTLPGWRAPKPNNRAARRAARKRKKHP